MEDFTELKRSNYGEKTSVLVEGGYIHFDPDELKKLVGAGNMTYDEYLDIQIRSLGRYRSSFEMCYFEIPMGFKGQIEKIAKDKTTICFKRIFVSGMFPDGEMFDGKEDHVWMDRSGFEAFKVGDCVEFFAEVYRYVKTGNGKLIDYSLRNPTNIKNITAYELPSDDDLIRQEVNQIICETCFLREQCSGVSCIRDRKERKMIQEQMVKIVKNCGNA